MAKAGTTLNITTFIVNCYTHFFIVLRLLHLLRKTAANRKIPSRISFVGSEMQNMNSFSKVPISADTNILDRLDNKRLYQSIYRYGDSKLLVDAFVRHLATLVPDKEVVINNLCPGVVATDFDRYFPIIIRGILYVYKRIVARTVEESARTVIYASIVCGRETHGKFLANNLVNS